MATTDTRLLLLSDADNVLVARATIEAGEPVMVSGIPVTMPARIIMGHKLARRTIPAGALVLKYGAPIGTATRDIAIGEHVHLNNLKSNYTATHSLEAAQAEAEGVQQ